MNSNFTVHRSRLKSLPTSVEVGNWDVDFRPGLKSASDSPKPAQMNFKNPTFYFSRLKWKSAVVADFKSMELGNGVAEFSCEFGKNSLLTWNFAIFRI